MKPQTTYLLAKYVADLRRMEPRNIGVILCSNGTAVCQFIEPKKASEFVNDVRIYERWVAFWKERVKAGRIAIGNRPPVPATSTEFLAELKQTQKENYILVDGGVLLEKVRQKQIGDALAFLFGQLVSAADSQEDSVAITKEALKSSAGRILERAGISQREDYKSREVVACKYLGVQQPLQFHYYIGNGKPIAVMQRVRIEHVGSVHSAAWMFERLRSDYRKAKAGSIIDSTGFEVDHPDVHTSIDILKKLSTVIDVANEDMAVDSAKRIVS